MCDIHIFLGVIYSAVKQIGCMQILYKVVVLDMLVYTNENINILLCMFIILIYFISCVNKYSSILFIFTQID